MKLVIINYGAGNIQSMFAIERLGYKAILSNDPAEIKAADKVIFPGRRGEFSNENAFGQWTRRFDPNIDAACIGNLPRNAVDVQ
jgi:imidazoleglycerol phosphate synthase glutamine amidotransferase subunit HisH